MRWEGETIDVAQYIPPPLLTFLLDLWDQEKKKEKMRQRRMCEKGEEKKKVFRVEEFELLFRCCKGHFDFRATRPSGSMTPLSSSSSSKNIRVAEGWFSGILSRAKAQAEHHYLCCLLRPHRQTSRWSHHLWRNDDFVFEWKMSQKQFWRKIQRKTLFEFQVLSFLGGVSFWSFFEERWFYPLQAILD